MDFYSFPHSLSAPFCSVASMTSNGAGIGMSWRISSRLISFSELELSNPLFMLLFIIAFVGKPSILVASLFAQLINYGQPPCRPWLIQSRGKFMVLKDKLSVFLSMDFQQWLSVNLSFVELPVVDGKQQHHALAHWMLRGRGWYKINTNTSRYSSSGYATFGGVVRDNNEANMIVDYLAKLGCSNVWKEYFFSTPPDGTLPLLQ
ncbi:hypothetical protein V6N13_148413 [Hibiscus sabdariffa]